MSQQQEAPSGLRTEVDELEGRVAALEQQVRTLSAALDAASRMYLGPVPGHPESSRIGGGRAVRLILQKGGLVHGYPEQPAPRLEVR